VILLAKLTEDTEVALPFESNCNTGIVVLLPTTVVVAFTEVKVKVPVTLALPLKEAIVALPSPVTANDLAVAKVLAAVAVIFIVLAIVDHVLPL
jgi:hypothetical protein